MRPRRESEAAARGRIWAVLVIGVVWIVPRPGWTERAVAPSDVMPRGTLELATELSGLRATSHVSGFGRSSNTTVWQATTMGRLRFWPLRNTSIGATQEFGIERRLTIDEPDRTEWVSPGWGDTFLDASSLVDIGPWKLGGNTEVRLPTGDHQFSVERTDVTFGVIGARRLSPRGELFFTPFLRLTYRQRDDSLDPGDVGGGVIGLNWRSGKWSLVPDVRLERSFPSEGDEEALISLGTAFTLAYEMVRGLTLSGHLRLIMIPEHRIVDRNQANARVATFGALLTYGLPPFY